MPDNNGGSIFSTPCENRNCCCGGGNGFFGNFGCGCDSEILFFIIIFLLLFTNFGCCNRG